MTMRIQLFTPRPLDRSTAIGGGRYEGPTVRIEGNCSDCRFKLAMRAERFPGMPTHYCAHESTGPDGRLLDGARTPRDCPLWDVGEERMRERERRLGRYDDNWCPRCGDVKLVLPKWWENMDVCDACEKAMEPEDCADAIGRAIYSATRLPSLSGEGGREGA